MTCCLNLEKMSKKLWLEFFESDLQFLVVSTMQTFPPKQLTNVIEQCLKKEVLDFFNRAENCVLIISILRRFRNLDLC